MKGNLNPEYSLEVRKIIGKYFSERRNELKMNQSQLALKMGISQSTVAKIENGSWNFSMDFLILFCKHLDLYLFLPAKESDDPMAGWMRNRYQRNSDNN